MPDPAEPAARTRSNALLRERVEELSAAYEWMRGESRRINEEVAKVTGRAESADAMVSATVGPRGQLLSLTLDPRASRRVATEELAQTIVETVNRAARDAVAQAAEHLAPILPPGLSIAALLDGGADPADWQPERPLTESTFDTWWSTIRKDGTA